MNFAIYARPNKEFNKPVVQYFFNILDKFANAYYIHDDFLAVLNNDHFFQFDESKGFNKDTELNKLGIDFLVSVGGDGTLLDTLSLVQNTDIPVMGINTGRLGFLANIPEEMIEPALEDLLSGEYTIEPRTLLQLSANKSVFTDNAYALNDFTIHKRDNSSMVTVETYLDGEYFNTYWADGVIAATQTGSTGYSLSCGGPIIFPYARNFILTPVAPHNLNIRPIILPDESIITFKVTGRGANYLVSLDSRYDILDYTYELKIQKAPYPMKLVKLNRQSFIKTLREKLKWGVDSRNE